MEMKFGLALPYNKIRSVARWARLAEEAGWDGCFFGDAIWCEENVVRLAPCVSFPRKRESIGRPDCGCPPARA